MTQERALAMPCEGDWLYGVLHLPMESRERGVLVIVGGPQYRIGSHRQFVLLARALADAGTPVLRFDCRGMGDSTGEPRTFEQIGMDVRSAVDGFFRAVPRLREVVLWGLCDAASAAMFYAQSDARVTGLVLVNPWARTEEGIAKAYLQHYYRQRLFSPALWAKIRRGKFDLRASLRSFASMLFAASRWRRPSEAGASGLPSGNVPLPARMLEGMERFRGRALIILCSNDLTAQEFKAVADSNAGWRRILSAPLVSVRELADANHTFSQAVWREQVIAWTDGWLKSW